MEVETILKGINSSLKSRKLYPSGHPAISTAVKNTYWLLSDYFKGTKSLAVGLVDGAIILEGSPVPDYEKLYPEVLESMTERNIGTIIIGEGVTEDELGGLFEILSSMKLQGELLLKEARSRGITHVTLKSLAEIRRNPLETYNDAVEAVKEAMSEVRVGKIPRSEPVRNVINEIKDTVFTDPNAIMGLAMIKNYDNYLFNHSVNVTIMAVALCRALKLNEEETHTVGVAALLHDVGKTGVSEKIIRKPGGLSSEEWEKIKEHPIIGSDIVKRMEGISDLTVRLVYEHHIKYDRTGYPEMHPNIHPLSQIITICDAYDALTTLRVYQKPYNPVEAVKIMTGFSGRYFDPETLKVFVNMLGIYPVGTMVRLSTGEIGVVTKINPEDPDRPSVKVLYDTDENALSEPFELDLSKEAGRGIVATINPATVSMNLSTFFEKEAAEKS